MANYEWISDFKMSMEAFRQDPSIYCKNFQKWHECLYGDKNWNK